VRDGILIREITNEEGYRLLPIVRAFVGIGGALAAGSWPHRTFSLLRLTSSLPSSTPQPARADCRQTSGGLGTSRQRRLSILSQIPAVQP